jgi:predicted transport protein
MVRVSVSQLVALGDDVLKKHLKYYVAFKRIRNSACVEVHPRAKKLIAFVNLEPGSIVMEEGFTRDVSQIGHFGTGGTEITITSNDDLARAMPLIEQSYEAS